MKGATGRRGNTLPTRIKRLMQKDNEVGRIAAATPTLISRAMELFLRKLCTNVADCALGKKAKTVSRSHLKDFVENDEMMDFLKLLVKDVPALTLETSASPSKRSCPFNGEKDKGQVKDSKRQRVKRPCSSSPETRRPISAFASMPLGSDPWTVCSSRPPTLQLSRSEMQPTTVIERPGRISSLPAMPSAVRTNTPPVDPSSLPIDLQKALNIPRDTSSISMSSTKKAASGNYTESIATSQEMDTPLSVYTVAFTKPMEADEVLHCAEEDNYEFSDDEA